jgi:hypothetical protein
MGLPMPRPEQPFASFEQTLPGPMMTTALWPLADVPKRMTLVHGRYCSRCSSLGAKHQLRSEASYPRSPSILLYQMCRIARSAAGAVARPNARFWAVIRALLTPKMKVLRFSTTLSASFSARRRPRPPWRDKSWLEPRAKPASISPRTAPSTGRATATRSTTRKSAAFSRQRKAAGDREAWKSRLQWSRPVLPDVQPPERKTRASASPRDR